MQLSTLALRDGDSHQDQHEYEGSEDAKQISTEEQKSHDFRVSRVWYAYEGGGLRVARHPPPSVGIGWPRKCGLLACEIRQALPEHQGFTTVFGTCADAV